MPAPSLPPTAQSALAWALEASPNPAALRPLPHAEFDADPTAGGFAFVDDTRWFVVCHNGSWGSGLLASAPGPTGVLQEWLARNRHAGRTLDRADLGPWQRAALDAVRARVRVADLAPSDRAGLETPLDRDHADWIWIALESAWHRAGLDPLRTLAADDALLAPPSPGGRAGPRTHPCPVCGRPATHTARYPRAVCGRCHASTVDAAGRRVAGWNTSLSGGFVARLLDPDGAPGEISEEVTRSGRCWVDGHACSIGEAHLGGVVVSAL